MSLEPTPLQPTPQKKPVLPEPKTVVTVDGKLLEESTKQVEQNLQDAAKLSNDELDKALDIETKRADIWWTQKFGISPTTVKVIAVSLATLSGILATVLKLKGC